MLVAQLQEPAILGGGLVGLQLRLAPGRQQVADVMRELLGVGAPGNFEQRRLRVEQPLRLDRPNQTGEHPAVLKADQPVNNRVQDQWKLAQRNRRADPATRCAPIDAGDRPKPRRRRAHGTAVAVGHGATAADLQLPQRARADPFQPSRQRQRARDQLLQPGQRKRRRVDSGEGAQRFLDAADSRTHERRILGDTDRNALFHRHFRASTHTAHGAPRAGSAGRRARRSYVVTSCSIRSNVFSIAVRVRPAAARTVVLLSMASWVMSHDSRTLVPPSTGSSS